MKKYRSKSPHRIAHPKIWVWSHTEKAEINYFQAFKNNLRSPLLMPDKIICRRPQQLIPRVIDWKQKEINDEDGDRVWIIFDVDAFFKTDSQNLLNLINKAHENNIKIAYVNECFEHWLLLHFERINGPVERGSAIEAKINRHFKTKNLGSYSKNQEVFQALIPFQDDAIKNAKILVPKYEGIDWEKVLGDEGNPSTTIHFLIEEINNLLHDK